MCSTIPVSVGESLDQGQREHAEGRRTDIGAGHTFRVTLRRGMRVHDVALSERKRIRVAKPERRTWRVCTGTPTRTPQPHTHVEV